MLEWLLSPIDLTRPHEVGFELSWHARIMVAVWSVLIPVGVIWARFSKIAPGQKWPQELDNKFWWYGHLTFQYSGLALMIPALWLIWNREELPHQAGYHAQMGWTLVCFGFCQMVGGLLRGTKGGPTEPELRGAHFDMTTRRIIFEHIHKTLGYAALLLAAMVTFSGLWQSNAPMFMWISLGVWWILMILIFAMFQKLGKALDTYQAIWGPSPNLPGNKRKPIAFPGLRPKQHKDHHDADHVAGE